jgi:hypothetical protein
MKIRLMALLAGFCLVVGMPLAAMAGPAPSGSDTDGDGVDNNFDNCTGIANGDQKDTDHDGCGNMCDADYDQTGTTSTVDFGTFKAGFPFGVGNPSYNPNTDHDCTGTTSTVDFGLFKAEFVPPGTPGPSGISNASRDPIACP